MATFTVTTPVNFDTLSVKAGGDTYNINGGTLTINSDSRYCANSAAATGTLGPVTISSTLGGEFKIDGTSVRLIPYNTGTGNVPAIGTTISQGGVSAYMLGVWSAINVAPTAAGVAMPASGYIKVRAKTGGDFAAGALTGIGATATGADIVGWIEVSGDEASTLTVPRLGKFTVTGDWFDLGTTSGARNQIVQLPTNGSANTWFPGVWIETAVASGVYEFYPSQNVLTNGAWTTANHGTDSRSKFVQCITAGQIRIGSDGTNNIGYLPVSGCKIRIPNVILMNNTTAARGSNAVPHATLATRYDLTTTSAGQIDIQNAIGEWYLSLAQAYSVTLKNCAFFDQITISETATALDLDAVGIGQYANADVSALIVTSCFAGGTIQNCTFGRAGIPAASDYSTQFVNSIGLTLTNNRFYQAVVRTAATAYNPYFTECSNFTLNDNKHYNGGIYALKSSNFTINNTVFCDRHVGTTNSTQPIYVAVLQNVTNSTVSGLTFDPIVANVHPYAGLFNLVTSANVKIRNIGTSAARLTLGSANQSAYLWVSGSNNTNIEFKRIYLSNTRTGLDSANNTDTKITYESVWGDAADPIGSQSLNTVVKGGYQGSGTPVVAFTSVYGTHFWDSFTAATTGRVGILMNEATSLTSGSIAATATAKFSSTGSIVMPAVDDECVWTWPHYILGYTGYSILAPTLTGTLTTNQTIQYQIDKNDGNGFGAWHNLAYYRTGAGGSGGTGSITMTSTTGVEAGDYVFGTGVGTNARVTSITNATTVAVNVNNAGAVSGTLTFNQLPFETGISATNGHKLKIRAKCHTANTTNALTGIYFQGITDSTSQQTQYPLDPVAAALSVTGLQAGTEVRVYRTSDDVEIAGTESSGTSFTYNYQWTGSDTDVYIVIHSLGYVPVRYEGQILGSTGLTLPVQQQRDRVYVNP